MGGFKLNDCVKDLKPSEKERIRKALINNPDINSGSRLADVLGEAPATMNRKINYLVKNYLESRGKTLEDYRNNKCHVLRDYFKEEESHFDLINIMGHIDGKVKFKDNLSFMVIKTKPHLGELVGETIREKCSSHVYTVFSNTDSVLLVFSDEKEEQYFYSLLKEAEEKKSSNK